MKRMKGLVPAALRLACGALLVSLCVAAIGVVVLAFIWEGLEPHLQAAPVPPELRPEETVTVRIDDAHQRVHREVYQHLQVIAAESYGEDGSFLGGTCDAEVHLPALGTHMHVTLLEKNALGHVVETDLPNPRLALLGVTQSELEALRRACRFPSEVNG